ncbi:MAG: DUF4838 domain-containing protein [Planctomycetota bacterium]
MLAGSVCAEVAIAENLQAKAVIAALGHKDQATTLSDYLHKITGALIPVVNAAADVPAGQSAIVLEMVDKVPGASDRPSGRQAYRIKTESQRLTLTAASDLGLTYAVLGLLEDHLGCRFYTYHAKGLSYAGPGYEIVPSKPILKLDKLDDLQEPAFAQRGFIYWVGSYPWVVQNRGAGYPAGKVSGDLSSSHSFYDYLPPQGAKDAHGERKGLFAEHPEFYPLNHAGKRQPDWSMGLCGTNPELPKFLAEALAEHIELLKSRPGAKYDPSLPIPAAQGDGFSGCQCEACRKLVQDEQSESAPLILLLNRALDILAKTHPDQQVITFAYFETLDAPKTLKPHKNLWINVVSSAKSQNMAGDQVGPIVGNPANRDYAKALRDWPKIAPGRVTTWHWVPYDAEWPAIFYLGGIMKYWQECGIYGTNPQLCGNNWKWLYAWVYLKLAWNPNQDADKLIRQFLEDNYGTGAAPHIWEYLKLAQQAYADSGHVPSAVRWSGWTATTRVKMFAPSILAKMTAAMDQAQAAAEKEGDKALLANFIAARGTSLDAITLCAAANSGKPWGPVRNPHDGKNWFVAGADPLSPACLERTKKATFMDGGDEHGVLRTTSWFVANNGGPLVELDGQALAAAVCPDLKGQITSATDKQSRKELLAVQGAESGYRDLFERISSQIWLPVDVAEKDLPKRLADKDWSTVWSEYRNPAPDRLETDVTLSPPFYGWDANNHLRRTVAVTDSGLRIERKYVQAQNGGLPSPARFSTRWMLALPDPALAKVAVKGGGAAKAFDLRYAVPGGIRGVKAGERLPGWDAMDQRFDEVVAVSDAEVVKLPLAANAPGDVTVQLDRGDGVAAALTTPATGWEAIELKPVVEKNYLQVTLLGVPVTMDKAAKTLDLPVQTLSAKPLPAAKPAPAAQAATAQPVAAKIKDLGNGRALNELDGAELVWIPAGEFLRGSPEGKGAGDERPQKKIYLDGYWIYKYPVTLQQYRKFCQAAGKEFQAPWGQTMHADPKGDDGKYPALPNWYEAADYAKWAGAGLPTEAQWEKAARGPDGREYPWGNDWDPEKCVSMERTLYRFSPGMLPVGSSPQGASPYGVEDLAGNCWEWVADWYDYEYYRTAPEKNPAGPEKGSHKVLRGGDSLWDERFARCAARMVMPPHVRDWVKTGFRCVIAGGKQ